MSHQRASVFLEDPARRAAALVVLDVVVGTEQYVAATCELQALCSVGDLTAPIAALWAVGDKSDSFSEQSGTRTHYLSDTVSAAVHVEPQKHVKNCKELVERPEAISRGLPWDAAAAQAASILT